MVSGSVTVVMFDWQLVSIDNEEEVKICVRGQSPIAMEDEFARRVNQTILDLENRFAKQFDSQNPPSVPASRVTSHEVHGTTTNDDPALSVRTCCNCGPECQSRSNITNLILHCSCCSSSTYMYIQLQVCFFFAIRICRSTQCNSTHEQIWRGTYMYVKNTSSPPADLTRQLRQVKSWTIMKQRFAF